MSFYPGNPSRNLLGVGGNSLSLNKKKVKNFSYSISDKVGKGYSSIVYKGTNEDNSKSNSIQDCILLQSCLFKLLGFII